MTRHHPNSLKLSLLNIGNYSVPLFNKEGLGEILLDKSPSTPRFASPPFSKGGEYLQKKCYFKPFIQHLSVCSENKLMIIQFPLFKKECLEDIFK
jgi:hypothetical protein